MSDTKISEATPATYGIRVKGNLAIVGVLPVPLKDFPVKNPEWDERYEEVPLYLHPQPAELAGQQGVELPPMPPSRGFIRWHTPQAIHQAHGFTSTQMQEYALAALAATGKQQVDPAWSLHDRVEFALRDAGFDFDEASRIALQVDDKQQVGETCNRCENGIAVNSNSRTEEPCRHCKQVGEVQGSREQFEAWARTQLLVGRSGSVSPSGQIAWQAWEAAIAARQTVCGTCAEIIQPNALTGTTCSCARQPGVE